MALVAGVCVLAGLVWSAVSLLEVRSHALVAADHVGRVQRAVDAGDAGAALTAARAAAAQTGEAREAAGVLPLRLVSHLPVGGRIVRDLRTVVGAADLAVAGGAVPLLEVVDRYGDPAADDGLVRDGAVDIDLLRKAAGAVAAASDALSTAAGEVAPLDPESLPPQVRGGVEDARAGITGLAAAADTADRAFEVLPAALGADGPRSYLVVFQNPAEARPTGGLVGTWALVAVDRGRASLTGVGSNDDLVTVQGSAEGLDPERQVIYGTGAVRLQNVNLSPDFAVAGPLLSQIWAGLGRPEPDGVVALDPQGLAPLLEGKGDIAVDGGPAVNADTVVDVLLSELYTAFADDNPARKQYLSTVVGTVFADALGGGALSPAVLTGLVDASREGHLLAWSSRAEEQEQLVRAGVSGTLPPPASGSAAVYLTNVDASKLDYYLSASLAAAPACTGGAPGEETLSLALTNSAPAEVPEYVDNKLPGRAETTHTTQVALYLPPDRGVVGLTVDGAPVGFSSGTEAGWSWLRLDVDVPRDRTVTVSAQLRGGVTVADVRTQPLVNPLEVDLGGC